MNRALIQLINIIKYRLEKSVTDVSEKYFDFKIGKESRSPSEILAHLKEVSCYGLSIIGLSDCAESEEDALETINNNFSLMKSYLCEKELTEEFERKLVNGPLSDTLTHIGQLAYLRRLEGNPIEWENYTNAEI